MSQSAFLRRDSAEVTPWAEAYDEIRCLVEEHANRIGRQIMRDNALELLPQLKDRLWKDPVK